LIPTSEDIRDDNHGVYQFANATSTLQSLDFADHVGEPARKALLALTEEALLRHNAKNITVDGKTIREHPFGAHYIVSISVSDTTAYASTLDEHVCPKVHIEPYSYPRQHTNRNPSIALAKMGDLSLDADIGLQFPQVKDQGLHAYPTSINDAGLDDHLPEPEFYNDPSNTKPPSPKALSPKEVSFQSLNPWSIAYAGIGAQFSP
jgi:hypothetical protein